MRQKERQSEREELEKGEIKERGKKRKMTEGKLNVMKKRS